MTKLKLFFKKMLVTYKDNANAIAYAHYCLAWLEVQKAKYQEAIERLQASLNSNTITDRELASRTQFMIGRTYMLHLHDNEKADQAFIKVLSDYPGTKKADHTFLVHLKK